MIRSGKEQLESIRDGRSVYIGSERVTDVTVHPAFRNAAQSVAAIYDLKAAAENRDIMTFVDDVGDRHSSYYLQPRSRDDLRKRTRTHQIIADSTHGMWGRSPDHVSSFVTAMAMKSAVFARKGAEFGTNIEKFYRRLRAEDANATYAVVSPQAARDPEFYQRTSAKLPSFRVVDEKDDGIVVSGMKMLATGGVFSNYIFVGNIFPRAKDQLKESVTCAVPVGARGVSLWSRKPLERHAQNEFESPLTWRFDETDSMVICENVKIPWEFVFTKDDSEQARAIYIETPAHSFGNHQSNVRYQSKLKLIVGLASRVAKASGVDVIPAVRENLGRLASLEALLAGNIAGQIEACEDWDNGFVGYNRRMMYAALNWCTESYSPIVDSLRDLCGGGVFQMPADVSVLGNPELRNIFESYFLTPQMSAKDRMKLFKLAWDVTGSEFAGRHQQYEKFYAGASFVVKNHCFREAPWEEFHGAVDRLLASYDVPSEFQLTAAE